MLKFVLDFLYPPFCLACKERSSTKFLCLDCWFMCAMPDPIERCRHCFEGLDWRVHLCNQCRYQKELPCMRAYVFEPYSPARYLGLEAVDAMASFAVLQWFQLDWPIPDAVIPMPDKDSLHIGRSFAHHLNFPFVRALTFDSDYKEDRLEEEQTLLLFDVSNSMKALKKACDSLNESFPKRVYLLSLLPYVDHSS